ncbi:MAG: hypothetical protein M3304_12385 [Actinomycetota bacterium]|nr:hypothetical protein [Actinomycetota bacterium]
MPRARVVSPAALASPRTRRLAVGALVFLLLVATAAAFAVAERLKLERAPVTGPRFERLLAPTCACEHATATLRIRLREPETIDASMVDARGERVRTLAAALPRPRGSTRFTWDGRDDEGNVVSDGRYRLRLDLREDERSIVIPTPVRVDATPPRLQLLAVTPRVFSPDGDGRGDRVLYRYRASEGSRARVYVDGKRRVRGWFWPAGAGRVPWRASGKDGLWRPGAYRTWITALDRAGNESERSRTVVVRIRYVELRERRIALARRTLTFTVGADAKTVAWTLRAPTGRGRVVAAGKVRPGRFSFRLPRRPRPGRYVLRVAVGAESDRALVVVAR